MSIIEPMARPAKEQAADLKDPASYPEYPDLECDLVMKGGISSGVVYPLAACSLATRYAFKSVGGTSAGAIAAAAVAAAEHGRRADGFVRLARLPEQLGDTLATLFQPAPSVTRAFDVLSVWVAHHDPNETSRARDLAVKCLRTAAAVALSAPVWFVSVVVFLLAVPRVAVATTSGLGSISAPAWVAFAVVGVPLVLVLAAAVATVVFARSTLRGLAGNGFGLCDGHTGNGSGHEPLTDWMERNFDDLAGLPPDRRTGASAFPLTFGDLWGEEAVAAQKQISARDREGLPVDPVDRIEARRMRDVDLVVMTTNVSFQRPYQFPFTEDRFSFCPTCLAPYFSAAVLKHIVRTGKKDDTLRCPDSSHAPESLVLLPPAWDLPVVVAARISLSFPGLISAVPLVALGLPAEESEPRPVKVWFSDGGMSSNFPMHFFDALLPGRPTFGINLTTLQGAKEGSVYPPKKDPTEPAFPTPVPIENMAGFARSILNTMQDWVDNLQIGIPGFRERIVTIAQAKGQGGMNLTMPKDVIEALAGLGAQAGGYFDDFDLDQHKWIRYRVAMPGLDDMVTTLDSAYHRVDYGRWLNAYAPTAKLFAVGGPASVAADLKATQQLIDLAGSWAADGHPTATGSTPAPKPALTLRPRQ
jgi:predicted acylesterase/phospholipase RssA